MNYKDYIAIIEDFPKKGISFKDVTPLIANNEAFKAAVDEMGAFAKELGATVVVGPESRGFIFGCPIAVKYGMGFVPIRKPGKLPRETIKIEYTLEYGKNVLEMHKDALKPGDKVVIVDDLLATGGTVKAVRDIIEQCGATLVGCVFVVELTELHGKDCFKDVPVKSLVDYPY